MAESWAQFLPPRRGRSRDGADWVRLRAVHSVVFAPTGAGKGVSVLLPFLLLPFALSPPPAAAAVDPAAAVSPVGRWLNSEHDGVIEIVECGPSLCGRIVGITLPGMPEGTPGMPGNKPGPLDIYVIGKGSPKIYATI